MATGKIVHRGAGGGTETLPPAGDAQREVLAERADNLAEAAETIAPDAGAINPKVFRPEREIRQHFDELYLAGWPFNPSVGALTSPDGMYVPCWVPCMSSAGGRYINQKRYEGWEIVQAHMHDDTAFPLPEHLLMPDNTYRLADVLLMRIRVDKYVMIQRRRRAHQRSVEDGVASEVEGLADKAGVSLIHTHEMSSSQLERLSRRSQAQTIASRQFDQQIREGSVRGAPAPR